MLLSDKNKMLAEAVSFIVCWDKLFCKERTKLRIIDKFSDAIFENSFLNNLGKARYYTLRLSPPSNSGTGYKKIRVSSVDIITGESFSMVIDGIPANKTGAFRYIFETLLNDFYVKRNLDFVVSYLGVVNGSVILKTVMSDNYHLVYLPNNEPYIITDMSWPLRGTGMLTGSLPFPKVWGNFPLFPFYTPLTNVKPWGFGIGIQERFRIAQLEKERIAREKQMQEPVETEPDESGKYTGIKKLLIPALLAASLFMLG